jgi:hypothetical protein
LKALEGKRSENGGAASRAIGAGEQALFREQRSESQARRFGDFAAKEPQREAILGREPGRSLGLKRSGDQLRGRQEILAETLKAKRDKAIIGRESFKRIASGIEFAASCFKESTDRALPELLLGGDTVESSDANERFLQGKGERFSSRQGHADAIKRARADCDSDSIELRESYLG